jgi:hypothetical protein
MISGSTGQKPAARRRRNPSATHKWQKEFLATLGEISNVTAAAEKACISLRHVYKVRREDPEFARRWQVALCEGYDNLELELLHRARRGTAGAEKDQKFDNAVAFRLLTAHRESAARQRALQDNEETDQIIASINAKLDLMRERAIAAGEYTAESRTDD